MYELDPELLQILVPITAAVVPKKIIKRINKAIIGNKIENAISILKKECNRLNDFGVNTRYPNNMDLELEDAKIALKDAEKIKEFILNKIN